MIYLAVPYSNPSPRVRHERFEAVNRFAAIVMQQGHGVFSPISHSHPIEEHFTEAKSWSFWQLQDLPILRVCESVLVLCLDGWEQSVGVAGEVAEATKLGIPVYYINPQEAFGGNFNVETLS